MIDIHCHMLPGIDDGPGTMDDAVAMARIAVDDGIDGAICTPHWHPMIWPNDRAEIVHAVARFQTRLLHEGVAFRVWAGSELSMDASLDAGLDGGLLQTLNGGPWVLLELPGYAPPPGIEDHLQSLRRRGYHVVLAHPERYDYVRRDPARLYDWVSMGVAVQITASSVLGRLGPEMAALCRRLLEHRLVHFLASDSHGVRSRRPLLRQAVDVTGDVLGEREARRLVDDHPLSLLRGEPLDLREYAAIAPLRRKRSWFRFLLERE
ncbi:tyrosine-protein phosphatase [Desulfomicrobium salsuginis]